MFFRRSAKAKRIGLKVPEPGKVILTIPRWASEAKGREFYIRVEIGSEKIIRPSTSQNFEAIL